MSSIEPKIEIDTNSDKKCNTCPIMDREEDPIEVRFWSEDPNVLFRSLEFFPTENMTYSQKMNSITRLIILLAIIGFLFSQNIRLIFVAALILLGIYLVYTSHIRQENEKKQKKVFSENFNGSEVPGKIVKDVYEEIDLNVPKIQKVFDAPTPLNPMSNVLMTDYDYNPHKKPAPPAFNENVSANILSQAKQMVIEANPGQPNIADKLFRNLGDEFIFEQSMRPFVSNPSTTIPNDQQAFADFCYGSMISSKEGNLFSLARNLARHQT